jgi:SAM-dependent methyltransferase
MAPRRMRAVAWPCSGHAVSLPVVRARVAAGPAAPVGGARIACPGASGARGRVARVVSRVPVAAREHATLARTLRLLRVFRLEQTQPDVFYGTLARDSVAQLGAFADLGGATVLDVGGGPGFFSEAFGAAGARYVAVDVDAGEMRLHRREPGPLTVQGSGMELPFRARSLDLTYSSNVAEHVPDPWRMGDEMVRVTRPGGIVALSYTLWYGPWGGHETSPWHLLGGGRAADRYALRTGHRPKNDFGRTMFAVTAADGLRWARTTQRATLVAAMPRYLPWWAMPVVRVPGVREVVMWNLLLILRVES